MNPSCVIPLTGPGTCNAQGTLSVSTLGGTVTGGAPPYAYAWTKVSGYGGFTAPSNLSSDTVQVAYAAGSGNNSGVFQCKVTDNVGNTDTKSATVTFSRTKAN